MIAGRPEATAGAIEALTRAIGSDRKGLPPVERWNPAFCGDIDMEIRADGRWFYLGTPIGRMPLVKLFASVLTREAEGYRLVTPVEKVGIRVVDLPFMGVEMAVEGGGEARALAVRTNVDDIVTVGPDHALRFDREADGAIKPAVHVRRGLWARLTRALTHQLLDLCEEAETEAGRWFVIQAGGMSWPVEPAP
jgi:hypothetical protein